MKIIYVAKHLSGGNDDEGAITYALRQLGHTVKIVPEQRGFVAKQYKGDLVLFHGWDDPETLAGIKIPKCFWFFDMVTTPTNDGPRRDPYRKAWLNRVLPLVDLGFCTDGDWVDQDTTGKLHWLMQGADERVIGLGTPDPSKPQYDILCFSKRKSWRSRISFVSEMRERYGDKFYWANKVHKRSLADLIANSKLVVAPDSPVTDRYWSNRVYIALGFGAFLIHPYSEGLSQHYDPGEGIFYYDNRDNLYEQIDECLELPNCQVVQRLGIDRTLKEHTYRHRCEHLIATVEKTLNV